MDDGGRFLNAQGVATLREEVDRLTQRVDLLERALESKPTGSVDQTIAQFKWTMTQLDARSKAISEYLDRDTTPEQLAARRELRTEINEYLKARGFDPLRD